jgi:hypothetical protein
MKTHNIVLLSLLSFSVVSVHAMDRDGQDDALIEMYGPRSQEEEYKLIGEELKFLAMGRVLIKPTDKLVPYNMVRTGSLTGNKPIRPVGVADIECAKGFVQGRLSYEIAAMRNESHDPDNRTSEYAWWGDKNEKEIIDFMEQAEGFYIAERFQGKGSSHEQAKEAGRLVASRNRIISHCLIPTAAAFNVIFSETWKKPHVCQEDVEMFNGLQNMMLEFENVYIRLKPELGDFGGKKDKAFTDLEEAMKNLLIPREKQADVSSVYHINSNT